ncbi:MAG: hypothetical protein MUO26_13205 [Methanotrichaceae archaeon]|nr:hypothetical protein [Methanotrichaceae archaeon]
MLPTRVMVLLCSGGFDPLLEGLAKIAYRVFYLEEGSRDLLRTDSQDLAEDEEPVQLGRRFGAVL